MSLKKKGLHWAITAENNVVYGTKLKHNWLCYYIIFMSEMNVHAIR